MASAVRAHPRPAFVPRASLITFVAGLVLVIPGRPEHVHLRPRDMYLTVSSWVVVCIFAALPLLTQHISYTDSSSKACPVSPPPVPRS